MFIMLHFLCQYRVSTMSTQTQLRTSWSWYVINFFKFSCYNFKKLGVTLLFINYF